VKTIMSEDKSRGCLKTGCFGCLGIGLLGAGVLVAIAVVGLASSSRPAEFEEEASRQELPASVPLSEWPADGIEGDEIDLSIDRRAALEFPTNGVGTLELDLSVGEFFIIPSDEATGIEVDAEYDTRRFELKKTFTPDPDGNWTYQIEFSGSRSLFGLFSGDVQNRIEIRIPKNQPMRIVGRVRMGKSEIDLGGLAIEEVDLEAAMGEHSIEFTSPTQIAMERFHWRGSMGEGRIYELGNASPQEVDVSHRMGEMRLDLDGSWANDSMVTVECRMGQCSVQVPEDVFVETGRTSVSMGERTIRLPDQSEIAEGSPTITIDASGSMGELRIN
jgi:hypothetical protein